MNNKKNKKYLIYICIVLAILTIILVFTQGKYKLQDNTTHSQISEKFYFESNLLDEKEEEIIYNDMTSNDYELQFNIKNYKDLLQINNIDTEYELKIQVIGITDIIPKILVNDVKKQTSTEIITDSNQEQILTVEEKLKITGKNKQEDKIIVKLSNIKPEIEQIKLKILAISKSPYSKTLSKKIIINKTNYSPYEVSIVNSRRI